LVPRAWWSGFERDFEAAFDDRWSPHVESYSTKDGELIVRFDLPGVDPKDVDVSLEGDTLTLTGERKSTHEGKAYREMRYGRFERTLTVPEGVDPAKVQASYTNGVLEIRLPVPTSRKVPIQIAQGEPKKAA
jgi:HSP20 family protein